MPRAKDFKKIERKKVFKGQRVHEKRGPGIGIKRQKGRHEKIGQKCEYGVFKGKKFNV